MSLLIQPSVTAFNLTFIRSGPQIIYRPDWPNKVLPLKKYTLLKFDHLSLFYAFMHQHECYKCLYPRYLKKIGYRIWADSSLFWIELWTHVIRPKGQDRSSCIKIMEKMFSSLTQNGVTTRGFPVLKFQRS